METRKKDMKMVQVLFFNDQAAQNQKNQDHPNLPYKRLQEKAHSVQICGSCKSLASLALSSKSNERDSEGQFPLLRWVQETQTSTAWHGQRY